MNQKLLLIVLCALAVCTVAQCASVDDGQATAVRQGFRLPNLFNFEQFKAMFHKHYQSLAEELMRQRLFLARAFNAFISMVKFRHFQSDYYLSVNPRSDETPEERLRKRMKLENPARTVAVEEPQQAPAMEPSELREKLAQIEEHKSDPEYKPMADELRELQKDDMFVKPGDGDDDEEEVQEVSKKNPLKGFAANMMKNPLAQNIMNNPLAQNVGNVLQNVMQQQQRNNKPLPDEVMADLRETGCMPPIDSQGDCGSCYSFSSLAMFEYLFCRATGHQVRLSKQYVISCGTWTRCRQCNGAYFGHVLKFIERYGMEPEDEWPYLEANGTCSREPHSKGSIQLKKPGFGYVLYEDFDEYLKERPILIYVDPPLDFDDFGGGMYAPTEGCLINQGHAMLIIGHGRQDGKEYYLFRNSYGTKFGEQGYLKFSKEHMRNCTSAPHGFGSEAEFAPDAFEQLKAQHPSVRSVRVPTQMRLPPLDPNSERARLVHSLHPDYTEFSVHDPFWHGEPVEV